MWLEEMDYLELGAACAFRGRGWALTVCVCTGCKMDMCFSSNLTSKLHGIKRSTSFLLF